MNAEAIDREALVELVRQALGQIHDPVLVQAHPLCSLLASEGRRLSGEELQEALLTAVRQLQPAHVGPQPTRQWRRYRYLWLRYVEGVGVEEIAGLLGVTDRQARRDHREALEAVAAKLWARYRRTYQQPVVDGAAPRETTPSPRGEEVASLEGELARLSSAAPQGPALLPEMLQGALRTAASLLASRGLVAELEIEPSLAPVAVNPAILRQILMSLLAHLVQQGECGRFRLTAANDAQNVSLTITPVAGAAWRGAPSGRSELSSLEKGGEAPLVLAGRLTARVGGSLTTRPTGRGAEQILVHLPAARTATILVVDDNPDFLRLCQRCLEDGAYRVLSTNLASEALRLARNVRPDVVVLDVLMPSQDGWELLASLQQDELTRHIPVVICSVLPEPSLALGLGATTFLLKPVTPLSLMAALERVLAEQKARRDLPGDTPPDPRPEAHQDE